MEEHSYIPHAKQNTHKNLWYTILLDYTIQVVQRLYMYEYVSRGYDTSHVLHNLYYKGAKYALVCKSLWIGKKIIFCTSRVRIYNKHTCFMLNYNIRCLMNENNNEIEFT